MLLSHSSIRSASLSPTPFPWGVIGDTFASAEVERRLVEAFPRDGFDYLESTTGRRQYRQHRRRILDYSEWRDLEGLDPVWRELGEEVLSRDYLAACEAASGIDLDGTLVDLAFWRLDDGCWNGPHAAETLKLLTHIIYLSPDWSYDQGGLLRILYSEDIDDVHHEVVPISGDSVMFTPGGENSWHAVTPVLHGSRKSVTVHLYDPAARDRPSYFDFPGAQ